VPFLPSIFDDHPPLGMAGILADPVTRTQHVTAIVNLVMTNGFDGIDLDYETFAFEDGKPSWPTTKTAWIAFVVELGAELHARGKLLSVTVPPVWNGGISGYPVYAWQEIAPHVDRLRIMVYDWSWSGGPPGPIAPIWWVEDVLDHAQNAVPISKVELGVPAYGREWTQSTVGRCPTNAVLNSRSHEVRNIPALITSTGATPLRDNSSGEMRFTYSVTYTGPVSSTTTTTAPPTTIAGPDDGIGRATQPAVRVNQTITTCTVTRVVWYPDATSLAQKSLEATSRGAGIAIWALGYESTTEWSAWSQVATSVNGPGGTAPMGWVDAVDTAVPSGGSTTTAVRVRGWALDPEGDLPISVRITVGPVGSSTRLTTTHLARGLRADLPTAIPGAGEFHAFDVTVPAAAGADPVGDYQVCVTAIGRYLGPNETSLGCTTVTFGPSS
jgi:hypothetical protein